VEKSKIEAMNDMMKIQGADGNWNYDPYMQGLYNGMEMMLSIAEGREPIFREAPQEWLSNRMVYNENPPEAVISDATESAQGA